MPKNTVSDPITDQEIAFARLILSGTMNDRRAAQAVGLTPDTAAYIRPVWSRVGNEVTVPGFPVQGFPSRVSRPGDICAVP